MELNQRELALKDIYDDWQLGKEKEHNGYSTVFRMGFPDEYIHSNRPLLLFVGQEDLGSGRYKTQEWVRIYQTVQRTKMPNERFGIKTNKSAFWNFYRRLTGFGYDTLWDNLDKLLIEGTDKRQTHLSLTEAAHLNSPYGEDRKSVLQREIDLLKPNAIIFAVGPDEKYVASLAAAFSVNASALQPYKPNHEESVRNISSVLGMKDTIVLWTYHPNHLRISKLYGSTLLRIQELLNAQINQKEC